jgi:hypothetical protein
MTRAFDYAARNTPDLFDLVKEDIHLDQLKVNKVSVKQIRKAIVSGTNSKDAREMIRVWCHPDAPTNTASFVIGKTMRMLPDEVRLVVTFADTGQRHQGIIYQALNFKYLGQSATGIRYVDSTGIEVTPRLANVYRMRNPERFGQMTLKQIREELGWQPVISHPKHRYAIGVGKHRRQINEQLDQIAQPYPKEKS